MKGSLQNQVEDRPGEDVIELTNTDGVSALFGKEYLLGKNPLHLLVIPILEIQEKNHFGLTRVQQKPFRTKSKKENF